MKRVESTLLAGTLTLVCLVGTTAQAQAQEYPVYPVQAFVCNYIGDKGIGDLNAVNDDFNKWADDAGLNTITSLVLIPDFHSEESRYDVIGMDIWQSGAAMGSGTSQIMNAGSLVEGYDDVVDCPAHQMFALVGIKPPQDSNETAVLEISDCTVKANHTSDDGIAAVEAVSQLWSDWGVGDAHGVFFPVAGETGDADYTFKWVTRYPSWEAYGAVFDHYASGAVARAAEIIDNVMQCNSSRIYNSMSVREMADE